jgi:hypothetical protein
MRRSKPQVPALVVVLTYDAKPRAYVRADTWEDESQLKQWARADRRVSAALRALGIAA